MTWRQLTEEINRLTPEQQNTDVTVWVRGVEEFYPTTDHLLITGKEEDRLNAEHPYLQI